VTARHPDIGAPRRHPGPVPRTSPPGTGSRVPGPHGAGPRAGTHRPAYRARPAGAPPRQAAGGGRRTPPPRRPAPPRPAPRRRL